MPLFHHPNRATARPRITHVQLAGWAAGALTLAGLGLGQAQAQVPPQVPQVPNAGTVLEETRQPPRPPQVPPTAPRVVDAPARPTITMPEGSAVAVSEFRISGAVSYSSDQLKALLKPWVGRRLDIAGLNEAAGAITRFYQSSGHLLTYAYLPAQRVADGVIEIAVLEGRLEGAQIVTAQDVRLRDEVIQAHTDSLPTQPPLLQADVERKLLLLNDIPGVTARAAFTPGSTTGGAEMVVSVAEDDPLVLRGEVNNHGSRSTGTYRAGLSVQLRDLFGWGDSTQARLLASNKGSLVSGSIGTVVPLGGDGWKLGADLSHLRYLLQGRFKELGAAGSADTFGLDGSYAVLRGTDTNFSVKGGWEIKRLRDDVQLIGSNNPKRANVFELAGNFDALDRWSGATAARVSAYAGDLHFLDDGKRADDLATLRTGRSYRKLAAQVLRQQSLSGPWSLYGRVAGQATGGNLDSSEKFSLSGPGAVRAYAPGEAAVDQGYLATLELRNTLAFLGGGLTLGWFYDHADGRINRRPLVADGNRSRLAGTGLSVLWNTGDWALSGSLAFRTGHPGTSEGDSRARLYLQLSVAP